MRRTIELRLHARQYDFVFSTARYAFYVGRRGAGKSYAGALRAIFATQAQPGSLGLVGAPTHPMLRDAAQRMFFELCPASLIRRHNKTEQRTVMRNGSEILWRSPVCCHASLSADIATSRPAVCDMAFNVRVHG